ncbi:hypothetical protein AY520_11305 [Corynebacterium diphtheriae bv. mitis]|nr:hypothetical protein AY520_11305 [Corynebacterium diphtheriae bv. mitis]
MVEDWDAAVADPRGCAVADAGYRVAGFISEWWPTSNRNAGRLRVGMGGRLPSESAGEVLAIEGVVPRQPIAIDRDAEQARALRRAQKRPSCHRPAMPEPSRKGRGRS